MNLLFCILHSAFCIRNCSRSSMYRAPRFERGGCRRESCRECQFTGMWLNPNSRGSRLRIWQPWGCNSLHAHHFTATGFSGNSRPRRLKIAEPSGCKSRVADQPSLVELWLGKPACGSQGIADRFGSRSNSLGSASLPTPTNLECPPVKRAGPRC